MNWGTAFFVIAMFLLGLAVSYLAGVPKECLFYKGVQMEMRAEAPKTEVQIAQFQPLLSDCDLFSRISKREVGTTEGSMFPLIQLGDILCFKNVSVFQEGDIVPYSTKCMSEITGEDFCICGFCPDVLHRIIRIVDYDQKRFYLFKGDNNAELDFLLVPETCVYPVKAIKAIRCEENCSVHVLA